MARAMIPGAIGPLRGAAGTTVSTESVQQSNQHLSLD
jgi:hypothetical protein